MLAWGGQRHSGGAFLFGNRNSILLRYAMQNEASILRFRRPPSPVGFGPSNEVLLRFFVSVTQECRPGLGNGPAGFELASGMTSCDVTPSARFAADVRRRHLVVTSSRPRSTPTRRLRLLLVSVGSAAISGRDRRPTVSSTVRGTSRLGRLAPLRVCPHALAEPTRGGGFGMTPLSALSSRRVRPSRVASRARPGRPRSSPLGLRPRVLVLLRGSDGDLTIVVSRVAIVPARGGTEADFQFFELTPLRNLALFAFCLGRRLGSPGRAGGTRRAPSASRRGFAALAVAENVGPTGSP